MAVKKKIKTVKEQSESAGKQKKSGAVSTVSTKPREVKPAHKANNQQKMKNDNEQKEAKQISMNMPLVKTAWEVGQFLNEVRAEARKINWPERSQVIRETVSVLFLVTLITLFVWLFDLMLGKFVFVPIEHWGHLYGIGGGK